MSTGFEVCGGFVSNPQTGVVSGGSARASYGYNTKTDTGVAVGNNNIYAEKDSEIYGYNKSSGLEQHTDTGWQSVNRPRRRRNIQNQQAARATRQQRWDSFRSAGGLRVNSGVVGSRIGSSGGLRGGGRFRR